MRLSEVIAIVTLPFLVLILCAVMGQVTFAQESFSCSNVTEIPQLECEALVAIRDANPDALFNSWSENSTPCQWGAVTCLGGHVTQLRITDGYNRFRTLPPEIGDLSKLTSLILYSNALETLPSRIGDLSDLSILLLFRNQLAGLPSEIGNLSSLTVFDISHNNIASLPPEIGNLTSIVELDISLNKLVSLPPDIGRLTSLNLFSVATNQLESVPPELASLSQLPTLYLNGNEITELPIEVLRSFSLDRIALSGNPITFDIVEVHVKTIGSGTVEQSIAGVNQIQGTPIDLTAVPDADWNFSHWESTIDIGGQGLQEQITINAAGGNHIYTAHFELADNSMDLYLPLLVSN